MALADGFLAKHEKPTTDALADEAMRLRSRADQAAELGQLVIAAALYGAASYLFQVAGDRGAAHRCTAALYESGDVALRRAFDQVAQHAEAL
jgi:hypothetical protein